MKSLREYKEYSVQALVEKKDIERLASLWQSYRDKGTPKSIRFCGLELGIRPNRSWALARNPDFHTVLRRLELLSIPYEETLRVIRAKATKVLADRDVSKEKTRDLGELLKVSDDRLRLIEGKSTQNIGISAIIDQITRSQPVKDGLVEPQNNEKPKD